MLHDTGVMLPGKLFIYVQPLELSLWREVEEGNQVDLEAGSLWRSHFQQNGMSDILGTHLDYFFLKGMSGTKELNLKFYAVRSSLYQFIICRCWQSSQVLSQRFKSKFSALRIDQFPHRYLTKEPILAMEIDLADVPPQPAEGEANIDGGVKLCIRMGKKPALRAKVTASKIDRGGMLAGYGLWWSAELGNEVVTSDPRSPQRSWKQLIRWLDQPRFVEENEEIQVGRTAEHSKS